MEECPICKEKLTETNICRTKCKHSYCLSCLLEHLKEKNNCPLCRSVIFNFIKRDDSNNDDILSLYCILQISLIQIIVIYTIITINPIIKLITCPIN